MEPQSALEAEIEFEKAREAILEERTLVALPLLEKAIKLNDNPSWYSYLGYCTAKERGQINKGIELCKISIEHEPENPHHYLNLGRIHLTTGNKNEALILFRQGMALGGSSELIRKLQEFGTRKPPIFNFLPRKNPVNRFIGFILTRLGLR